MSQEPINMNQIRRIIQLLNAGYSIRRIAVECKHSRNTIRAYKSQIDATGMGLDSLLSLNDADLNALILDPINQLKQTDLRFDELELMLPNFAKEMCRVGMTKELLWQEYLKDYPNGYAYTQFCHYLNAYIGNIDTVMHFDYRMGEKMMVDFAGKKMSYINEEGKPVECQIFISVLPYSGYSYVEAVHTQSMEDFVSCIENAFRFYGGVPQSIKSDNLKSYVKRRNRYEPQFIDMAEQLSVHYNTTLMAARVKKPREKGSVEVMVNLTYQRVFAPLRNVVFRSLKEMNRGIRERLEHHHQRPFRGERDTRAMLMEEERKHLKALPFSRIEIKRKIRAKVQKNYHILLGEDRHYYSVPYAITGSVVDVIYNYSSVEIYLNLQRVAIHPMNIKYNGYSTNKYGNERLTTACRMAESVDRNQFTLIENILKNNSDKLFIQAPTTSPIPTEHNNIRGSINYQ